MTAVGAPRNATELRQDAAILRRKCPKFADDFAAKSADNALKFRTRRGTAGLPIQE
jgi:hypothetical protein